MCPPADKKAKMEKVSDDFSLTAGLGTKVDTKPKTDDVRFTGDEVDKILCTHVLPSLLLISAVKQYVTRLVDYQLLLFSPQSGSISLDALSALGDTLAAPEPKPELPKLRPEDIVSVGARTAILSCSRTFSQHLIASRVDSTVKTHSIV